MDQPMVYGTPRMPPKRKYTAGETTRWLAGQEAVQANAAVRAKKLEAMRRQMSARPLPE